MTSKPGMPSGVMPVAGSRPVRSIWSVMIFRLMASDSACRSLTSAMFFDVEAVVVRPERRDTARSTAPSFSRSISSGGSPPPSSASTSPASKACTRVMPSTMIRTLDPLEGDVVGVTPVGVLDEVDLGLVLPRLEHERAVGDDVLRVRPVVAELLDRRLVDRQEQVVRDLLDEPRLLRGQLDLERVVVDRRDRDLVAERVAVLLAAVVFGGALDPVELVGVVGRELGVERPLPRVLEVLRRHRVAVRPRRRPRSDGR